MVGSDVKDEVQHDVDDRSQMWGADVKDENEIAEDSLPQDFDPEDVQDEDVKDEVTLDILSVFLAPEVSKDAQWLVDVQWLLGTSVPSEPAWENWLI